MLRLPSKIALIVLTKRIHASASLDQLIREEKIELKEIKYHGKMQYKFNSKEEPELSLLSAEELEHIEKTIKTYSHINADRIRAYYYQVWPPHRSYSPLQVTDPDP